MRYITHYWDTTLLLNLTWCILNEDFSLQTIIVGFFAAIITITIVRVLFSKNDDIKNYRLRPILFVWFIGVLFYQIIRAGIETAIAVFTHNVDPTVVEVKTKIHNHWYQCLIANSITLTPGTITIDKTDHSLKVLWLYPTTENKEEQAKALFGPFEQVLKKGDYRH